MDFDSWVDLFYSTLLQSLGSTKELIWEFIARCIKTMFEELRKVHVGAQNATAKTDPMV
jgi:hypothetical protein